METSAARFFMDAARQTQHALSFVAVFHNMPVTRGCGTPRKSFHEHFAGRRPQSHAGEAPFLRAAAHRRAQCGIRSLSECRDLTTFVREATLSRAIPPPPCARVTSRPRLSPRPGLFLAGPSGPDYRGRITHGH